jgi:hypothetical protein
LRKFAASPAAGGFAAQSLGMSGTGPGNLTGPAGT